MKDNKILIEIDDSCEMAAVSINGKCVMEGNYWDFHPGCHGIEEWGDFRGHVDLAKKIAQKIGGNIIIENYKYL